MSLSALLLVHHAPIPAAPFRLCEPPRSIETTEALPRKGQNYCGVQTRMPSPWFLVLGDFVPLRLVNVWRLVTRACVEVRVFVRPAAVELFGSSQAPAFFELQ